MNRLYLTIFERGKENWGAFVPDISGAVGVGDTVEQARDSLLQGIEYIFEDLLERALPFPEAKTMIVDFAEFDIHREQRYEIEWLAIDVPDNIKIGEHTTQVH